MSSTEQLGGRTAGPMLACASLSVLFTLSGCSLLRSHPHTQVASAPPEAQATESSGTAEPQTVTDALADQASGAQADTTTTVMTTEPVALKPTAPKNYVVQRGDTLWGIANMFLRNPWQWPEIWYVNPQIHNPHRIYPGDAVRLALAGDGRTVLQLVRGPAGLAATRLEPMLRSSALEVPIETVPYDLIAAFISHPEVLTHDQVEQAPYIVALAQDHNIAGTGHEVYVRKLQADAGARFSVLHVDEPLIDPDNGQHLGYVAVYTGTVQVTRPGSVAEAVLTSSARETLQGDVLIPQQRASTEDFVPHPPARAVTGRVMDVVDNVLMAGQYEVIVLNRGTDAGLDRGSVLTIDQDSEQVTDLCASIDGNSTCRVHGTVTLPGDPAGTVLIFRAYPHLSYGLILSDTVPIKVGDQVRSP